MIKLSGLTGTEKWALGAVLLIVSMATSIIGQEILAGDGVPTLREILKEGRPS